MVLDYWYVMSGWMSGRAMYIFHTNQIKATMNNQSNCHLQKSGCVDICWHHLIPLWQDGRETSVVTHFTWDYDDGIETIIQYIYIFWEKVFSNMNLYCGNTNRNHSNQQKRHLEVELASAVFVSAKARAKSKWVLSIVVKIYFLPFYIISPSFSKV